MHDILEGALQYEIKLMIKIMVEVKQYFTLGKHKLIPVSFIILAVSHRFVKHKANQH